MSSLHCYEWGGYHFKGKNARGMSRPLASLFAPLFLLVISTISDMAKWRAAEVGQKYMEGAADDIICDRVDGSWRWAQTVAIGRRVGSGRTGFKQALDMRAQEATLGPTIFRNASKNGRNGETPDARSDGGLGKP
jgi:hypothetical protein